MMRLYKKLSLVDVVNFIFWLAIFIFYIISFKQSEYKLHGFLLLTGLAIFTFYIVKIRSKQHLSKAEKYLLLIYPAIFLIMIL